MVLSATGCSRNQNNVEVANKDKPAVDKDGNEVTDFEKPVHLLCPGGEVIASSNGDPNCHEDFTSAARSLFHGKAQFIVRCKAGCKHLTLTGECEGISCQPIELDIIEAQPENYAESVFDSYIPGWSVSTRLFDSMPDIAHLKNDPTDNNSFEPVNIAAGTAQRLSDCIGKFALYTASVNIPQSINGKPPILHFSALWGKCSVYLNRQLIGQAEGYWNTVSLDYAVPEGISGRCELIVCVESTTKYGCGVCGSVMMR